MKKSTRLAILVVVFVIGAILLVISKLIVPPSFVAGAIRYGLFFAVISWVWNVTKGNGQKE